MAWSKAARIKTMLVIDALFFALELSIGIYVSSLALTADAFHMLNDIISLAVGLWAVNAAKNPTSDKYSFGWLRAEIVGAFGNAVFLIALCLTIFLQTIERLIEPPEITYPQLIFTVGCFGLASNLVGFFILGGHGHSHGPNENGHSDGDEVTDAEEGHNHNGKVHDHSQNTAAGEEEGSAGDVFSEAVIAKVSLSKGQRIRFSRSDEDATTSKGSDSSMNRCASRASSNKHRRRASSTRNSRFATIDDISIHPASFRQDIIARSKPRLDGMEYEDNTGSDEDAVADDMDTPTENSPLFVKSDRNGGGKYGHSHDVHHPSPTPKPRHDSWHVSHNHNKPKKPSKGGHDHSHGDMGMNAMILHVIGDALGNVGVMVAALFIWLTSYSWRFYADPVVSFFITLIILKSCLPLTKASAKILLQATPDHIDVNNIKEDIQDIPGVISCHHVHIWQLSDTQIVASLHIQLAFPISEAGGEKYMELSKVARKCLHAYGIHSATIQPEFCVDRRHNHWEGPILGLDGIVGQKCALDSDSETCLLECIDECQGRGCCSVPAPPGDGEHNHSDHEGHTH